MDPRIAEVTVGGFRLGDDLDHLRQVARAGAGPAVVFYSGRILEVLLGAAAGQAVGETATSAYANIKRLDEAGWISPPVLASFHTLRQLTNEARHVLRRLVSDDVTVSLAALRRLLDWYFVTSGLGPMLQGVSEWGLPESPAGSALSELLEALEAEPCDFDRLRENWSTGEGLAFRYSPVPAALYAEYLVGLDLAHHPAALKVTERSLERFPEDVRLRQVRARALQETGRVDESRDLLETLDRARPGDPETLGLLASAYKRMWKDDKRWASENQRVETLRRCGQIYYKAWQRSEQSSLYTGINAASMALLAGNRERSQSIAQRIVEIYEKRRQRVARGRGKAFKDDYWDQVTLPEAELLLGRVDAASAGYRDVFDRYRERRAADINVTRAQLALLLRELGCASDVDQFLSRP